MQLFTLDNSRKNKFARFPWCLSEDAVYQFNRLKEIVDKIVFSYERPKDDTLNSNFSSESLIQNLCSKIIFKVEKIHSIWRKNIGENSYFSLKIMKHQNP
jgi:hypothetical protein